MNLCNPLPISFFNVDLRHMFLLLKSIPSGAEALIFEVQQHITKIGLDVVNSLRGDNVSFNFSSFYFFTSMLCINVTNISNGGARPNVNIDDISLAKPLY